MQDIPNDTSHDLLVKYLLGEATPEEVISIEQWLQRSEDNRHYFVQLKAIWDESKQLAPVKQVDEEEAWQRFRQRTESSHEQAPVIPITRKRSGWLRVAAVILLVAGSGYLAYFTGQWNGRQIASAGDKVVTYTLPDGTTAVLNKNASLSYPRQFKGNTRTVTLKGEAFFTVTADSKKPFIVAMEDVSVKVVGTSFNIKNTDAKTEVVVETGMVDVSKNKNSVQLRQNEKAVVLKDSPAPEKISTVNSLYKYYRTNQFICVNTPLPELVATLNDAYNARIRIGSNTAANLKLTTTFAGKSLEQILDVISETLNIRVEKINGEIILK